MTLTVFLDTNVPIYAAGRDHPLKKPCTQILTLAAEHPRNFVSDAEVLQELIRRYIALRLWHQGREVFWRFNELMQERVEAVMPADVELAARMADAHSDLDGRDLLHAAVMHRLEIPLIISADKGFDRLTDLERLDPAQLSNWRRSLID